jgi:hypothetical protein
VHVLLQASAYPGFGKRMLMPNHDHVSLCKPDGRQSEAYREVLGVIASAAAAAAAAQQHAGHAHSTPK